MTNALSSTIEKPAGDNNSDNNAMIESRVPSSAGISTSEPNSVRDDINLSQRDADEPQQQQTAAEVVEEVRMSLCNNNDSGSELSEETMRAITVMAYQGSDLRYSK